MSSRIRSPFGTLAERTQAPGSTPRRARQLPCHVFFDDQPAVLLAWERRDEGWWGRIIHVVNGDGAESWVSAARLRPA